MDNFFLKCSLLFLLFTVIGLTTRFYVCIGGQLPGQIVVDPENRAWLRYDNGQPFFMAGPGDPEGFLYRGTRNPNGSRSGDQMDLIDKMKGTGANCIYLMAVRSHGGDAPGDPNDNSDPRFQNPFINGDERNGLDQDILEQWEIWFDAMEDNGIVIFFIFYDDSARVWNTGDVVGTQERNFLHALVNKFEHHKNLIWCIAEEYQERYSVQRVKNIAAEIRIADNYNHVISVHKLSGLDFSEFADDPNIDQFAIQWNVNAAALHSGTVNAWQNANRRYNLNMAEPGEIGTGVELRRKSWAVAMGGAYIMGLGMDIKNTPISDLRAMGRIVSFFESTPFPLMAPYDELKLGGTEYVLALPGDSYICYASNLSGKMGLKNVSPGIYRFQWFDIKNGNTIVQEIKISYFGNARWPKPIGMSNELAVYIKKIEESNNSPRMIPAIYFLLD